MLQPKGLFKLYWISSCKDWNDLPNWHYIEWCPWNNEYNHNGNSHSKSFSLCSAQNIVIWTTKTICAKIQTDIEIQIKKHISRKHRQSYGILCLYLFYSFVNETAKKKERTLTRNTLLALLVQFNINGRIAKDDNDQWQCVH